MAAESAVIHEKRGVSRIWLVPVLALVFGLLVLANTWLKQGPTITIRFVTADGLEAGKTKIKYRNVEMGVIESVQLNDAYDGVLAIARMTPQAEPLLKEDSNFWVVTARVGVGKVSGLETLLSGAYIQLEPGVSSLDRREFSALDEPPLTSVDAQGIRLQLYSETALPVTVGDRVFYRGFEVGRIESKSFNAARGGVDFSVFIDAPFDSLVNSSVRFWDSGGISLTAGAEGIQFKTAPLDSILLGGISFDLPENAVPGEPVLSGATFKLFPSYDAILKNPFRFGSHYILQFSGSVKGLYAGAPVEYRGIPVGRVERILLKQSLDLAFSTQSAGAGGPILVLIYVEPARLELPDKQASIDQMQQVLTTSVERGLRASLETGNLLTGAKYVALDYHEDAAPAIVEDLLGWESIPTVDTSLAQLQEKVSTLLDELSSLPFDQTMGNVNSLLDELKITVAAAGGLLDSEGVQALPQDLDSTLNELRAAIQSVGPDSQFNRRMNDSLMRLNRALENLEDLTTTLANKPNSAILPSNMPPDPVPKAPQ